MTSTLEDLNKNVIELRKELHDLKETVQLSNRYELAQAARKARAGEGTWHPLPK